MATQRNTPPPSIAVVKEIEAASKALEPAVRRIKKALTDFDPAKLTAGSLSDFLYDLIQLQKQFNVLTDPFEDVLKVTKKSIDDHFIRTLAVGDSSGVQGMGARVQINENVIPVPDDWEKIYAHIKKTGEFELLGRTLKRDAVQERWDAKKNIPGIGKFHAKTVSCTKLSKRKG